MNPAQMEAFRRPRWACRRVANGSRSRACPSRSRRSARRRLAAPWEREHATPLRRAARAGPVTRGFPRVEDAEISTQAAFGKILNDIARAGGALADAIVTTSPDVSVSTNLGAWVNRRGLFNRKTDETFPSADRIRQIDWETPPRASTSSSASRRTISSSISRRSACLAASSANAFCPSARSMTRSSRAASMR